MPFELQVDDSGDLSQRRDDPGGGGVDDVQIVAKDFHGDLGGLAAQALADAVTEEGDHFGLHSRIFLQNGAECFLSGGLIDCGVRLELDVELASVRAPGVFA